MILGTIKKEEMKVPGIFYPEDMDYKQEPSDVKTEITMEDEATEKINNKFKCDLCSKQYSNKYNLSRHKADTHRNSYRCSKCSKLFSTNQYFKLHTKTCVLAKKHRCQVCQKNFSTVWSLKRHIDCTHGEKQFVCNVCFKAYGTKSLLIRHQSINKHNL